MFTKFLLDLTSPFVDSSVPFVLISIAIMLIISFLFTRFTKPLRLPNVTAYILAGVLLGPVMRLIFQGDGLIPQQMIDGMSFITDLALAFIAFGVGRFFKFDVLKKSGAKIIIITLFESLMAALLVFVVLTVAFPQLGFDLILLLAAIASATAPASTMMTIRQTKAKGDFVNTILQVVSLDDAISLLLFSIAIAVITSRESPGGLDFMGILIPILLNLALVAVGFFLGWFLKVVTPKKRTKDNRLIITIAILAGFSGVSALFDISPLLGVMAMGMAYTNFAEDESLFRQVDQFSPPILTFFFVLSGMRLQLNMLVEIGIVGVVYFIVRIIGKYAGASLGSVVARSTENNKKYLGLALIPQAGVSLGLAALGSRILLNAATGAVDPLHALELEKMAAMLTTIIVSSGVLYEIFGPPSAKLSLYLTKSYTTEKTVDIIGPTPLQVSASSGSSVEVITSGEVSNTENTEN